MKTKQTKPIVFPSQLKQSLVLRGKVEDDNMRKFIRDCVGINQKLVEATRHSILSGPPGVGKSYGTWDECAVNKIKYIQIPPGSTDVVIAAKLAHGVYNLKPNEELVVILDDADELVFGDYKTLNKWKIAMGPVNYDLDMIPYYSHSKDMTNNIKKWEETGKDEIAIAVKSFQDPSDIGLQIPTDRVRFIVLCNKDLEDPKQLGRGALAGAIEAVLDRFNYKRINLTWEHQWGWLAHTLSNSQPFDDYPLSNKQKIDLLDWMYSNWDKLRSTSYRTVEKLAAEMINNPNDYEDGWRSNIKGQ